MKNGLDEEGRRKCKLRINITISFSHFRLVLLFGIQQIVSTTHLTQSLKLFNFSTPGVYPKTFLYFKYFKNFFYFEDIFHFLFDAKYYQLCSKTVLYSPSSQFTHKLKSQYPGNSHWPRESQNRKPKLALKELNKEKLASHIDPEGRNCSVLALY